MISSTLVSVYQHTLESNNLLLSFGSNSKNKHMQQGENQLQAVLTQ